MKSIYNPNYNAGIVECQIYYYYSRNTCTHILNISYHYIITFINQLIDFKLIYTVKQTRMSLFKFKI